MIGRLRGRLLERTPPQLLIDVNGVGYEVEAPLTTFYHLPETGREVTLFTHLVVREDAQLLFGFHQKTDRTLFRALIRVNGIGARVALSILSGMSGADLIRCIEEDNTAALVRLPGIGKKTAERLVIEMRDRIKDLEEVRDHLFTSKANTEMAAPQNDAITDAVSALTALGYKPQEAQRMVKAVDDGNLPSEELIRHALQATVKG